MRKKSSRATERRVKPLFFVGACLLMSGFFRVVGDVAPALAEAGISEIGPLGETEAARTKDPTGKEFYVLLREREVELDRLEEDLVARKEFVEAAEADIRNGLEALEESRAELQKLATATRADLAESDGAVAADIDQLVSVYEAMKPKEAAQLFEAMPPEFAAGFLARMRAEQAADILAGLNPDIGYHISALLASRHVRTDMPEQQPQ
jgi:flagellar motility protein MotE (MotC chaperone)